MERQMMSKNNYYKMYRVSNSNMLQYKSLVKNKNKALCKILDHKHNP